MTFQVRFTARAEMDIHEALRWLETKSPGSASARYRKLWEKAQSLTNNPERCPLADECADLGVELRELLIGKLEPARLSAIQLEYSGIR